MEPAEIVFLCILVAAVFFMVGYCFAHFYHDFMKCDHKFEEVLKTVDGGRSVVVHMCKECGKRKITKV